MRFGAILFKEVSDFLANHRHKVNWTLQHNQVHYVYQNCLHIVNLAKLSLVCDKIKTKDVLQQLEGLGVLRVIPLELELGGATEIKTDISRGVCIVAVRTSGWSWAQPPTVNIQLTRKALAGEKFCTLELSWDNFSFRFWDSKLFVVATDSGSLNQDYTVKVVSRVYLVCYRWDPAENKLTKLCGSDWSYPMKSWVTCPWSANPKPPHSLFVWHKKVVSVCELSGEHNCFVVHMFDRGVFSSVGRGAGIRGIHRLRADERLCVGHRDGRAVGLFGVREGEEDGQGCGLGGRGVRRATVAVWRYYLRM